MERRQFVAGVMGGCALGWGQVTDASKPLVKQVSILHTNDTHSRIDPFAKGRYKGLGGIARRAALIQQIKRQYPHTLVVDAGDIFQGTPYFNMFRGKLELKSMSLAGYDFSTLGNHDFDLGADWFLEVAKKHAAFPFVTSNLHFTQKGASQLVKSYAIKVVNGLKIGLFGLGVRFRGLVAASLHKGVSYHSPVPIAKRIVSTLRNTHKCHAVVLLSHLGYTGFDGEPGDQDIARQVPGIDVIIGGHTHTFLKKPTLVKAPDGRSTHIFQVGHSGVMLGHIVLTFDAKGSLSIQNKVHPIRALRQD